MSEKTIKDIVLNNIKKHEEILRETYKASIVDTHHFQDWIYGKFKELGLLTEDLSVTQDEFAMQPAYHKTYPGSISEVSIPKNVVGTLNPDSKEGIMLYAHADKVPVTFEYGKNIKDVIEEDGKYFGAGIADDVSGLSAMISALTVFKDMGLTPRKQIIAASILGKQSGVFGTYPLMKKFGPVDSAIYLHPAESGLGLNELKVSSNGIIEFEINVRGKSPDCTELAHAIFKNTAVNAIEKAFTVKEKLYQWADRMSEKYHHEKLKELTDISFAVMISKIETGEENIVIEMPLSCSLKGIICFPPNMSLEEAKNEFEKAISSIKDEDDWLKKDSNLTLSYCDLIAESDESDVDSDIMTKASEIVEGVTGQTPQLWYGHTMSDIRYPMLYWNAQTFGIGPLAGDIGQKSEWIGKEEYYNFIIILSEMLKEFAC